MKTIRITLATILKTFVISAPLILFISALATGKALFWGTPVMQFIPWKYLAYESLRAGYLPLWNPFNGMGAPLLANYQLAFFYPPTWIGYLFSAVGGIAWMAWGDTLMMALHLSWAALGMMIFQKKLRVGMLGQLISGLAFGMCGFLVARVGFFSIVIVAAWLPWMMLAVTSLTDRIISENKITRRSIKPFLFLSLCAAMQLLGGHAQVTLYTYMLISAWAVLRSLHAGGVKGLIRVLLAYSASIMLALMVAAIQLLPTIEYLLESQRSANVDYSIAMVYSFWPWRFLTLIFPNFFGNPGLGNYWGYANFWEDAIYIGILPLAAAMGTIIPLAFGNKKHQWDEKRTILAFFWVVIIAGFVLALGWNTPIFPFLYRHIPTFDMFNGPARFLIWVEFALAVLAGFGVEGWQRPEGKTLRWTRLTVAGSAAVSIGAALSIIAVKGVNITFVHAAFLAGILGALTAFLVLKKPAQTDEKGKTIWQAVVVLFVALDLVAAGWTMNAFIGTDFYRRSGANKNLLEMKNDARLFLTGESEYHIKFNRFFTFKSHFISEEWEQIWTANLPDTNILTGVQMFNNFDPLLPSRFARLNAYLAKLKSEELEKILIRLSVTTLEYSDPNKPEEILTKHIDAIDRYRLYPCSVSVNDAEEAWEMFSSAAAEETMHKENFVVIESQKPVDALRCHETMEGYVRVIEIRPTKMIFEIETTEGAWFEAADTWYPGWSAWIDGEIAEIYPSSFIFKSVYVPVGRHTVSFEYRPMSLVVGGVISLFGLITAAVILFMSRHTHRAATFDQNDQE